jgi:hypothetical protein
MPRQPWESEFETAYPVLEESLFVEHAEWEALSPLINFASPLSSLTFSNGVSIRQIDVDDMDYYFGLASKRPSAPVDLFAGEITHAITKQMFKPKAGPMPGIIEDPAFDTVISAMRLARPGAVSYSVVSLVLRAPRFGTQFPVGGRGSSWSSPGRRAWGSQYVLTEYDLPLVSRLVERLPATTANAIIARALARLNFSYERVRAEDALVDAWIALETLYLKRSEQAELGFRAALRLANFMGLARPDREWIYRLTKKSYDARSKVVHGDPTPNLIHNLSLYTREILRLTLKKSVESNARPNLDKIDLEIVRGKPEDL